MKPTIEEALDQCIAQLRRGADINEVLDGYPDFAAELRSLLVTANALVALPEPSVGLRGLMRELSNAMTRGSTHVEPERPSKFLLFAAPMLRVAASVVLLFAAGWGVSSISAQATPGDLTYPVKRTIERVRLFLTLNDENQAELRIVFSERRLGEAVKQFQRGEGLDEGLLRTALEESRLALTEALDVSPQERAKLVSLAGHVTAHQKDVIDAIEPAAQSQDQTVAHSFSDMCDRRMNWMEGMMQDMRMTPPTWSRRWQGPGRATAPTPSEETATRKQSTPSRQQMRQWMDDCPDWR